MNVKKNIFSILLILILCTTLFGGCISISGIKKSFLPADDEKIVEQILSAVTESEAIFSDLSELIRHQMRESAAYTQGYEKATKEGVLYDTKPYEQLMRNNKVKTAALLNQCNSIAQRLERMDISGNGDVRTVQVAAQKYFSILADSLKQLDSLLQFAIDQVDANKAVADFDAGQYEGDPFAFMQGLYDALVISNDALGKITTCPVYMKETFDIYLKKLTIYGKMLESMYSGMARGDVLRIYSAKQIFTRQQIVVLDYEMTLMYLFDLQYQKVNERLNDSIFMLKNELLSTCRMLLEEEEKADNISFTYLTQEPKIEIEYEAPDTIYPNLYPSLDSIVNMTATSKYADSEVLIEVEVVGFTQVYQQKATLTEQVTRLLIKPVILADMPDLSTSKDAMLKISVTDQSTGKKVLQESKTIKLMSVFDYILWDDQFGATTDDNILAWLTPESEGVLKLRRKAVDIVEEITDGDMTTLAGYQNALGVAEEDLFLNTYVQMVGLQTAISEMGVRYNVGAFSLGSNVNQRVLLPDYVLKSKSGICIETTMLLASAIQSANMHPMIIFTPGHAQVAVETWRDSGEYLLLETTTLPFDWFTDNWSDFILILSAEGWAAYMQDATEGGLGYVVDCDLVNVLGIQGIGY
ncbi:MAG: hypothetical protein ACOX75_00910 [Lachnospiraceae bacterium]|jgi:hypothetical protein